ncbi:MAG: peptidylprolyl isomerase, partial [Cyclobacteriaceae bacterium]|nr:peptidylprolyl isomerase [Cyclobacteriaceae bacterium]
MMKKYLISLLIILTMGGCGKDNDYLITIITPFGEMKAILYDETPEHKKNFIKLALEGKYDSTIFHRIIKEFMVQGGDINQKKGNTETIDYTIPAEFIPKYYHKKGALAAARQGDQANPKKASSGSQFYIVQGKTWTEAELTTDMNKLNSAVMNLMRYPGYDSVAQQIQAVYAAQDYDMYNQILFSLIPDVKEKMGVDVSKTVPAERLK